jgi:hypothetical protein
MAFHLSSNALPSSCFVYQGQESIKIYRHLDIHYYDGENKELTLCFLTVNIHARRTDLSNHRLERNQHTRMSKIAHFITIAPSTVWNTFTQDWKMKSIHLK